MSNANLAVSAIPDGETVGSTKVNWMLADNGTSARPNTAVHRVEITLKDPSAVLYADDDLDIMMARYYFSGGQPLILEFPEPIEGLRDWQTSTDSAFAITLKRVDTSTSVGYTLNVWHEEY